MNMTDRIGRRAAARFNLRRRARALLLIGRMAAAAFLLLALASPASAQEGRYFLRAGGGYSIPFLGNLNDELENQGNSTVDPGYSLGISLGRRFSDSRFSVEGHFSTVYYPDFDYKNTTDSFTGQLRHYNYMAIVTWSVLPEGVLFKPVIGTGLGYGLTNLISGGGKLGALEAVFTGRIDSQVGENIELSFECIYYTGMKSEKFENPYLQNVDTDFVADSAGNPLEDTFNSLDFRFGITVYLKSRTQQ